MRSISVQINLNLYNDQKSTFFKENYINVFHRHFYTGRIRFNETAPLNYITMSSKKDPSNFQVDAIFVNSNEDLDFECHLYINDEYVELNDFNIAWKKDFLNAKLNYQNGLKKSIQYFDNKDSFPKDLKGVKAILLVNKNEKQNVIDYKDIFLKRTEEEIFNALTK